MLDPQLPEEFWELYSDNIDLLPSNELPFHTKCPKENWREVQESEAVPLHQNIKNVLPSGKHTGNIHLLKFVSALPLI